MKKSKIFELALGMVKASKLRSWLTIIGIVIGIASVMAIVTTGEFFQKTVESTLSDMGGTSIVIYPGYSSFDIEIDPEDYVSPSIGKQDVYTLEKLDFIDSINYNVNTYTQVKFSNVESNVGVKGVRTGVWQKMTTEKIESGRFFMPNEKGSVIISNNLAKNAFGKEVALNQRIKINGKSYRVIGILQKKTGLLAGLGGVDNSVYISYKDVYKINQYRSEGDNESFIQETAGAEEYEYLDVKLVPGYNDKKAVEEMTSALMISRKVTERTKDFEVMSPSSFIESTKLIITGITLLLSFIAGIALLVGAVGIANTMFTAVLEKTKEIGIMKALGAKDEDVMFLFLSNSAIISLIGGIVGIILGVLLVQVIIFAISIKMKAAFVFTLSLKGTLVAVLVSLIVGVLAGIIPAKNAARLNPVDALRRE